MRRLSIAGIALAAACLDTTPPPPEATVLLSPLLDSLFVGDTTLPVRVTYYDAAGQQQPVGQIAWESASPGVATVDANGRVAAVGRGQTVISATTRGATGFALVVVTRGLEVTLLLDTVYLMRGDSSFEIPVAVRSRGFLPAPWFEIVPQSIVRIDSATGRVWADQNGGPIAYVVHADTVADTGAVHVYLPDAFSSEGRGYYSLFGTVTLSEIALARAFHFRRTNNQPGFRLTLTIPLGGSPVEWVYVTLLDSITSPGQFSIDSLSPEEASPDQGSGVDFLCAPDRPWGIWSSGRFARAVNAVSRSGVITITKMDSVSSRLVVGGWFEFDAQRDDYYGDPGAALPVRGTFVAPLLSNPCRP